MAWPVVIATNGIGIPVTESDNGLALPVEVAGNGFGQPVVVVASGGTPVSGSGVLPWDGVTKFRPGVRSGLNIVALAFETETPVSAAAWSAFMTPERWGQIEAVDPGYLRVPMDTTAVLATDGSPSAISEFIDAAQIAIDDCLAHGYPVLFNTHVASYIGADPLYDDAALVAAYPSGPLWLKAEAIWAAFGAMMSAYPSDQVGMEVYNETAQATHTVFGPMLQRLEEVVRARNLRTTLIFPPCKAASPEGFAVSGFTADMFGANSGFSVHSYIPVEFVYQSLPGSGYTHYISGVHFPAIESDRAAAKTRATNAINADGSLSGGQKTALIAQSGTQLDYYFDSFDPTDAVATYTYFFGSMDGGTPGDNLGQWIVDNDVNPADVHVTEFGAGTGAPASSRAAFLEFDREWWAARGWSSAVWVEDDVSFGIRDGSDFSGQLTAALGWTPNYLALLTDDFSSAALNPDLWSAFGDGASIAGGRVEVPMLSGYNAGFTSGIENYRLLGSELVFQAGFSGGDSSFNLAVEIRDDGNSANCLVFSLEAFDVKALSRVGGVNATILGGVEYDSSYAWLRVRETGGTVYFDHSADGSSWANFTSTSIPVGLSLDAVSVSFNAGAWNNQTGKAWVDNINV